MVTMIFPGRGWPIHDFSTAFGIQTFKTEDVTVDVGSRQRVDVAMQVGLVTESVVVKDVAAMIETDSSEKGQLINPQTVSEFPLNGRNYADLALLSTNVIKSPISFPSRLLARRARAPLT